MLDGLAFRAKADALSKDGRRIIDIKTTSSDVNDFHWSAKKYQYDLQAALYLELFESAVEFIFLVINKDTKDIGIFECSEQFIQNGRNAVEHGINTYKYYFMQDNSDELIKNHVIRGIL